MFSLHLYCFVAEPSVPPAAAPAAPSASHQLIAVARVAGPGGAPGAARPSPSNAAPRKSPHHTTYHHLTHSITPAKYYFTTAAHHTHHILMTTTNKQRAANDRTIAVTRLTQTNRQNRLAGMHHNLKTLLIIGCVERNPGPTHSKKLKICHVNINSITADGRLDELDYFVNNNDIDILALSETKLDDSIHPSLFHLTNFHTPFTKHRTRHGGGVATYIRSNLPSSRLMTLETDGIEWTWTRTKVKTDTFIICTLYMPPNMTADKQDDFIDKLTDSVTQAQTFSPTAIIIIGDFNAGNIFLDMQTHGRRTVTAFDTKLKDTLDGLNLTQIINTPTRITDDTANLLDLIVTDNTEIITDYGLLPSFSSIDHIPVTVTLNSDISDNSQTQFKEIWDFNRLDADKLTRTLMDVDWNHVLDCDIDSATEKFTSAILTAATTAIPKKTVRTRRNDKPWMTNELRRNIRKRDRLFKQAQRGQNTRHNTDEANKTRWSKWRQQRNLVTALNKRLRNDYIETKARALIETKRDPFTYHKILKSLVGRQYHKDIPTLETDKGDLVTNEELKATMFNEHFVFQTNLDTDTLVLPLGEINDKRITELGQIQVTEQQVLKALNSLDSHKSTGPDNVPTKLLKLIAILIYEPLTKLFNKSLQSGTFPKIWKEAFVTPIFKNSGSPSDVRQYRPISLLSCLSKILEKLVYSSIYSHLTENNLLSDRQSGYRAGHSTQLQLTYLTHNIYRYLDSGRDVTAIYLDISKYFDKIWHEGLLYKCKNEFFISGSLFSWLKSYLTDRTQRVRVGDAFSTTKMTKAGVPQGSVLGPLLALMYLDGLRHNLTNEILLYADDTSIHASHTTEDIDVVQDSLQRDLDNIDGYAKQWAIQFNITKTVQQTFSHKLHPTVPTLHFAGQNIPTDTETHKHLGITFSTDLRFHNHVNNIIKKANIAMSPLYPIAKHIHRNILSLIYTTYVRPHLDYCDIVFDGHITVNDELRLERVQRRAARLVTGTPPRTSTDRLRQDLGWETLKTRRRLHKLHFFHKLSSTVHQQPEYIKHILPQTRITNTRRTLRNHTTLTLPPNKTTSFQRSFIPATTRLWNTLPHSLRTQTSRKKFHDGVESLFRTPKPSIYYSFGSKLGNTYHTQIRTGSLPLNANLYQNQKSSSPHCVCKHPSETLQHFLLSCPVYQQIRHDFFTRLSLILGSHFLHLPSKDKIQTLTHGHNINTSGGGGREVAVLFQDYVIRALALRRAAEAAAGAADA